MPSRLLPLVSLITTATKIVPSPLITAYNNRTPCKCIESFKIGKSLDDKKEKLLSDTMETANPKLRAYSNDKRKILL